MRLLRKQILLEYAPPKETVTESGIILDWQEPDLQYAKVVHVGERCEWGIEVGQQVWFKRAVANKKEYEGTVYLEISEDMVLALKQ